jgi:hypothetical protein
MRNDNSPGANRRQDVGASTFANLGVAIGHGGFLRLE